MENKNPAAITKVDSIVRIPSLLDSSFFRYWFEFLTPIHRLTEREMDVITAFVKQRFELSKVVKDEDILDKVVMSEDTKRKVREECKITLPHFQVIMGKLRKNKLIVDGRINKRFIPKLSEDAKEFKLLLYFDLDA